MIHEYLYDLKMDLIEYMLCDDDAVLDICLLNAQEEALSLRLGNIDDLLLGDVRLFIFYRTVQLFEMRGKEIVQNDSNGNYGNSDIIDINYLRRQIRKVSIW